MLFLFLLIVFALCGAHHRGNNRHNHKPFGLDFFLQNPPKCKNDEIICEFGENEYPLDLVETLMEDYESKQNVDFYSKFFDHYESYMKWMHETGLPPFIDQHCNTKLEEVFLPKVGLAPINIMKIKEGFDFSDPYAGVSHVYIVQIEPYIVRKISFIKCLGKKDTYKDGKIAECKQNFDGVKMLTLGESGNIEPNFIFLPFGCAVTVKFYDNKTSETITSSFNG